MTRSDTRIVFMGTPEFATGTLKALTEAGYQIAGIVTAPDKPAGRGKKVMPPAMKTYAIEAGLQCPLLQPSNLKDPQFVARLKSLQPHLIVVVAFRMLPEIVWDMPELGTINLHASLLPQYRGAAPINWCIVNGETETGVTTFLIDHEIDTGKILLQEKVEITPEENAGSLHDKLMHVGAALVVKTLDKRICNDLKPLDQKQFLNGPLELKKAPKIKKEDCKIYWDNESVQIHNLARGMSPYPAAFSELQLENKEVLPVKIYETIKTNSPSSPVPGTIHSDNKTYLRVDTQDHQLEIKKLQLAGKKKMTTVDFIRGFQNDLNHCKFI